eukprot:GHUV01039541.1.p1 GENE.GHUV01039541.1~~GHUV01039541.1.p1  ORF type:complete len:183 (-),score=28.69 GHUV01039541.1:444-992(-)
MKRILKSGSLRDMVAKHLGQRARHTVATPATAYGSKYTATRHRPNSRQHSSNRLRNGQRVSKLPMYTQRAPGVLRSSTVSVKQQWGCPPWCPLNRRQNTAPPAAPPQAPPLSTLEPVQTTTVVVEAAAEPDVVALPPPPPPAPRLPPPSRSFFDKLTLCIRFPAEEAVCCPMALPAQSICQQ